MARRSLSSLAALVVLLTVAACSPDKDTAAKTVPPEATSSSLAVTMTTIASPTVDPTEPIDADITVPQGEGPFPTVVLVHGGGWVTGAPGLVAPLARHLTDRGFLTVNTSYALSNRERAGFPTAVEDVACAVRYAALHPDSDGTVAVIGHSAGAHIGALVALAGDGYRGECPFGGPGLPQRFVGLGGPYDVTRLGMAVSSFFGGPPDRLPELWAEGNPLNFVGENPDLEALIVYGELDGIVADRFAIEFHNALLEAGVSSLLERVEGARHSDVHNPEVVGDLIVTWLERN